MSTTAPRTLKVDALLFDKDGTLFDFHATWSVWAHGLINEITAGDLEHAAALADAMRYDLVARAFHPDSLLIAGTNREGAEAMAPALPGYTIEQIEEYITTRAATAPLAPAVPLVAYLEGLAGLGLRLGVMTNDTESGALAHLETAGITAHFDFVAGFDSGHGAKPSPDPLLAFARSVGIAPARVAMVGDSAHDLLAGRAAGMLTIGVLTGPACAEELAPLADVVLQDIGHIPAWIEQ